MEPTNTAEFGLKDESKAISDFVQTGLIDKLVDQLKNNPNLAKIELVYDELKDPIVLTSADDAASCMLKAKDLICEVLGKDKSEVDTVLETKVSELFGKNFKAKFYVKDTSKLDDEAVEGEDVIQGTYVEYTLEFVGKINVDETVMKALEVVKGTINDQPDQVFDVKIDTETNKGLIGFLKNDTKLDQFKKTNLMVAANSVLTNANVTKISLKLATANGTEATKVVEKEGDTTDYTNKISSEIMGLLESVLNIKATDFSSKTVKDLSGVTFTMKIYLGENTEAYDTDVLEESGAKYVQYVFDVAVDGNGEIQKEIFDVLNEHEGNNVYRISFDEENDHQVNVSFKTEDKEKSLADIYGTGSTGLVVMAQQLMAKAQEIKDAVNNITVNYNGTDYVIRTVTGEEDSTQIAINLFNAIFGTSLERNDLTVLLSGNKEQIKEKLGEATLGDLENAKLSITIELKDKVVQETNWEAVEKYDFNFIFGDTLPGDEG